MRTHPDIGLVIADSLMQLARFWLCIGQLFLNSSGSQIQISLIYTNGRRWTPATEVQGIFTNHRLTDSPYKNPCSVNFVDTFIVRKLGR